MRRFVQTLFRRREVFLLPVIVVPILALAFLALAAPQFQTEAVAWVETTEPVGTGGSVSGLEANAREAQRLNEWLSTDSFRRELIERANLMDQAERGLWPPRTPLENLVEDAGLTRIMGVRSVLKAFGLVRPETVDSAVAVAMRSAGEAISVKAEGGNLLHVRYLGNDSSAGAPLVEATIAVYRERASQLRAESVQQSIDYYTQQLRIQDQRQREASDALQAFLLAHPAPSIGSRPAAEAAELDGLQQTLRIEQALYENIVRTLEDLRLESGLGTVGQQQRIRIVDAPDTAQAAGFGFKSVFLILLTGLVIGSMFGGAAILWLTWLDSTVRSREDVMVVASAPVHLQVPQAPGGGKQWPHIGRLLAKDL